MHFLSKVKIMCQSTTVVHTTLLKKNVPFLVCFTKCPSQCLNTCHRKVDITPPVRLQDMENLVNLPKEASLEVNIVFGKILNAIFSIIEVNAKKSVKILLPCPLKIIMRHNSYKDILSIFLRQTHCLFIILLFYNLRFGG